MARAKIAEVGSKKWLKENKDAFKEIEDNYGRLTCNLEDIFDVDSDDMSINASEFEGIVSDWEDAYSAVSDCYDRLKDLGFKGKY